MSQYWQFLREERSFLGYGVSLTFLSSFGQTFFVSLFVPYLLFELTLSNTQFGAIYASATLGSALLLPWTGRWLDRVSLERFTSANALLLAASALLVGGAAGPVTLFLGLLGLRLSGPGLAGYTALTAMARRYSASRGKALSVTSLGFPLGEAALPLVGTATIVALGWRVSWVLVAGAAMFVFAPFLWILLRNSGSRDPGSLQSSRTEPSADAPRIEAWAPGVGGATEASDRKTPARQWSRREMLRDPRFWFVLPAALLPPFWATGIFLYQTSIADVKGWSVALMASSFTAFAVSRIGFTLIAGGLVDRFSARRVFPFSLAPLAGGLLLLWLFGGVWVPYAFMVSLGLTTGMSGNVRSALWAELYGIRHLGSIKALMASFIATSTAGSPLLVGWVLDLGTGLDELLLGGIVSLGVGSLLALRIWRRDELHAPGS